MTVTNILLIESGRASDPSFAPALEKKGYFVNVKHRIDRAISTLETSPGPDLVILDAASMRTPGTRLCRKVRDNLNGVPIILVSPEGTRAESSTGASLILVHPFTARKLLNRVARLLPGDERYTLTAGPLKLNLAQRKVIAHGKEARLTPKQAKLLEVFIRNAGRLMTRKTSDSPGLAHGLHRGHPHPRRSHQLAAARHRVGPQATTTHSHDPGHGLSAGLARVSLAVRHPAPKTEERPIGRSFRVK